MMSERDQMLERMRGQIFERMHGQIRHFMNCYQPTVFRHMHMPEPVRRVRKPRVPAPDGLRTMQEAAAKLGCGVKTLKGHIASGALRYVLIGHGAKRPRKMFTDADLTTFIANQTREDPQCPSDVTRARRSGNTTSKSTVVAFSEVQKRPRGGKRKK